LEPLPVQCTVAMTCSFKLNAEVLTVYRSSRLTVVPSEGWLELKIEGGVVSGVINLESPGVRAPGRRPRHDERYHEA
jgi:hypothetical protein